MPDTLVRSAHPTLPRLRPRVLLAGAASAICTPHGLRALATSGAGNAAPSGFGTGRLIEGPATNLATDPSFATLTAGVWASAEAGASIAAQTAFVVSGGQGARIVATGGAGWHYVSLRPSLAITTGDVITISCHAKQTGLGGNDRYVTLLDRGDASTHYGQFDVTTGSLVASQSISASGAVALPGGGYRCWITFTALSTYTLPFTGVGPGNGSGGSYTPGGTAESIDVDAFQCEKNAHPTSYTDGSLGTGYGWSGTAHASTSTRAGALVQAATACVPAHAGGTAAWFTPAWPGSDAAEHVVWHASDGAGTEVLLRHVSAQWRLAVSGRGVTATAAVAATHAARTPVALAAGWDGERITLRAAGTTARAPRAGAVGASTIHALTIGRRADSATGYLGGVLDSLVVLPWAPSEAALRSLERRGSRVGWADLDGGDRL